MYLVPQKNQDNCQGEEGIGQLKSCQLNML